MVEQEAVNFEVAGSSPAAGAKEKSSSLQVWTFFFCIDVLIGASDRANLFRAWSRFDSKKQDRKVYFSERAAAIQCSPAAGAK